MGVLNSNRSVPQSWVGSQALSFDANMFISTGGAKAKWLTSLVLRANVFSSGLVYNWTRNFAKVWS